MPLILVVEDEPAQVEILTYNLSKAGFRVEVVDNGEKALLRVDEVMPDLILLDWMLPEVSGIEVCRRLRAEDASKHMPIIMLTARGEEGDRIRGLQSGADDYVVKPYSPSEIVERVRALLRRTRRLTLDEKIEHGGVMIDLARHRVERNGRSIHLGPTEYRMLLVLMERDGRVLSRAQMLDLVWGHDVYVEERTVDVHVRRLRQALNGPGEFDPIRTIRGAGYAFDAEF